VRLTGSQNIGLLDFDINSSKSRRFLGLHPRLRLGSLIMTLPQTPSRNQLGSYIYMDGHLQHRFSTRGPRTTGGPRASAWWPARKGNFYFLKNINTQTDQFWQFSMAQFSAEVRDQETKVVSGPRVSKG